MTKQSGNRTLMGFDFGTRHIGVAIGQEITQSARGLKAIKARDGIPNWDDIEKLLKEWQPDLLVVGLPLNMDGSEQPLTARVKKFANRLHGRFGVIVELQDERLTTADAKEQLFSDGGFRNLQKDNIDCMSAALIVESYMASNIANG
ncbi:Holliday junction resolvase RuvX [Thalassotalea ponticola]|uniref:Holliday junction resolvase RuvX n=1 Tax=Thalassotalea ponticola TaxID=1523392 RepID=UPI0025B579F1|nr:Holliday junction resolvase RuvX [Thalassotalea ponticola]MDN3651868.1 Holliday junction resolvase RuvX [Thalassotalea ponticola]